MAGKGKEPPPPVIPDEWREAVKKLVPSEELRGALPKAIAKAITEANKPATIEASPPAELPAQRGRPLVYDWTRIVVEICWHLSGKGPWGKLKQEDFIANMQTWCKQECGTVPSADELRQRIRTARKRFPR
jgi:hypothetical protein